jgi:hypothetical protein
LLLGWCQALSPASSRPNPNPTRVPPTICRRIWKLKLDGSGVYGRLTYFSDYPGYKASNPVVSDDGRLIAFQLAASREAAGVGHGLFVFDIDQAAKAQH